MSNKQSGKADVLRGTLDLMVLQTLDLMGPQHGYAIATRLEQASHGALQLNMGTLYPALMRLEQRGLLRGVWGTTGNNRKARFYSLTAAGRRQLAVDRQSWQQMATIMDSVLRGQA
ncbi:MAG TPA: PadR family transcriptional regulator [Vicinamibacterales bacterium]|nr:PadR family transcriptional regulator [Vicinamibacterales bacterium]